MRAHIRTIKPEVFHDEELWALGERNPGLPILQGFEGLWCYADRAGRFEWRPRALGSLITPYWRGDFARLLDALEGAGFIERYTVEGRDYGLVVNLGKHQCFNAREPASVLPEPPARARTCTHAGKGMEGNGREGEGKAPPPANDGQGQTIKATYTNLDGWVMSDELRAYCITAGVPDIDERIAKVRLINIGGKSGVHDRDQWVRLQCPQWRRWREEAQAKASYGRAPAEPQKPKPPKVKGCPAWVRESHEATCRAEGHDVRREAMAWAKTHHINPSTLDRNIAAAAFTDHLTKLFQKGAA